MSRRAWRLALAAIGALLVVVEVTVRALGLVDFPIYTVDPDIGYFLQPNQAGAFLGKNRWVFNDRSLGVGAAWQPSHRTNVVVIGNSVVLGGNPYDQKDKVVPLIQSQLGATCAVWPVATGGWSTVNETRFLERNPDIVQGTDLFVWEYAAHGLTRPTAWRGEELFPTQRPLWATGYLLRKPLFERFPPPPNLVPATAATVADNYARFEQMLAQLSVPRSDKKLRKPTGIIFLYPDRNQLEGARLGLEWLPDRARIERIAAAHGLTVIDVSSQPQWTDSMYRDDVHPTPAGNAALAAILAPVIRQALGGGC